MRVTVTSSVDVATVERLFATLPDYIGQLRESAVEYVRRMRPPVLVMINGAYDHQKAAKEALEEAQRVGSVVVPVNPRTQLQILTPASGGECAEETVTPETKLVCATCGHRSYFILTEEVSNE